MRRVLIPVLALAAVVGAALAVLSRQRALRAGATPYEAGLPQVGDTLLPDPDLESTRAITIRATPAQIWPWLVQIGQGRGGFYSYDALENLLGLDIHSADHIEEDWQDVRPGDAVHLAKKVPLRVADIQPERHLVLLGDDVKVAPFRFVWSFSLRPADDGASTRLVVRERYAFHGPVSRTLGEIPAALSTVMTTRMLRGLRDRAEATTSA